MEVQFNTPGNMEIQTSGLQNGQVNSLGFGLEVEDQTPSLERTLLAEDGSEKYESMEEEEEEEERVKNMTMASVATTDASFHTAHLGESTPSSEYVSPQLEDLIPTGEQGEAQFTAYLSSTVCQHLVTYGHGTV